MVACPEGHQVSVVGWSGIRHTACTADVSVTQLVGQTLQVISCEVIIVPEHMIVGGATRTLCNETISSVRSKHSVTHKPKLSSH